MTRRRALWVLGVAAAVLFVVLAVVDGQIQDSGGPGIVSLELAWTSERAAEILADWDSDGQDSARLSLWLDFPFLLAYGLFFALAVTAVRDAARNRGWERFAAPGTAIAALPLLAAACDVVENVNLLLILDGDDGSTAPALAGGFAVVKFVALAIAEIYLIVGLVRLAAVRLRRPA